MHNPTTAFNPQAAGVGEADWSEMLNTYGEWQPARGHLLVVAPHPDDEVFGAGGLIHDCVLSGHKVTILSVTDGEGGDPLRRDLGAVRRQELRDALRKLSMLHVQIERLGLPDGRVAQHRNRLRNAILSLLDSNTTLVAPYEQDGHPDHGAAGRVCIEIARAHRVALARYPIWAWHQADPQALQHSPWVRFSLSAAAKRAKRRAIECFASQLRPTGGAPVVPPHVLGYFRRPYEAFLL